MENSIENIWKEGFLKTDALVAPRLNDLYNQKSKHIIDKFRRMFKMNTIFVLILALVHLGMATIAGVPWVGVYLFLLFIPLVYLSRKFSKTLDLVDANQSSYHYLKSFDGWLKEAVATFTKIYHFFYPLYFLGLMLLALYTTFFLNLLDDTLINLIMNDPDTTLVAGLPIYWIIPAVVLLGLSAYFGGYFYKMDLKAVYGGVMSKLEDILSDMEELRKAE